MAEAIKKSSAQSEHLKSKMDPTKLESIRNRLKANHKPKAAKCATYNKQARPLPNRLVGRARVILSGYCVYPVCFPGDPHAPEPAEHPVSYRSIMALLEIECSQGEAERL